MATLFRDRAVAGRAASELTDKPVRIVGIPAWAALSVAVLLLALLGIWLFAGSVSITTQGIGVITNVPANTVVRADRAGRIAESAPPVGTILEAGDRIAVIRGGSGRTFPVTTPIAGTIVALGPGLGGDVTPGVALATVAPDTDQQVGHIFLPVDTAPKVSAGDQVYLEVDTVDPTEDGLLEGDVVAVNPLPADPARIAYLTANAGLTEEIVAGGPVIEVKIELTPDPQAPSGWRWSLPPGPKKPLVSGAPSRGTVILAQVRPYEAFLGTS